MTARLEPIAGGLAFYSPYSPRLVEQLKRDIPYDARSWDGRRRCWIVDPAYANACVDLAWFYLGERLAVPTATVAAETVTQLFRLLYLGTCKVRADGQATALGNVDGEWRLVFPEAVLRAWFCAEQEKPGDLPTLYAVLTVKNTATDDEIKRAHRRLALQWHPDRCSEPDAAEQFKTIHRAYEILSDPKQRKKYDAALKFEASVKKNDRQLDDGRPFAVRHGSDTITFRSPLRCGYTLVEGQENLGRFNVSKIYGWEDIVDAEGRVLVTSWPMGAKAPEENWA